jgi:hypothetical protein
MFNPTKGSARERLDSDEVARLQSTGTLVTDDQRRRPLYFDGRFLAARDLVREQNYFLARQSTLGRAGGMGVVHGLMVTPGESATAIQIASGHGITPLGEIVVLPEPLSLNLADIPETQRLDAAFGLSQIPRSPARNRSGLFVVALRPVEFTANPIASYPTSITGTRSVHDGEIIEGVAVTLIPYADGSARTELEARRAYVAREVFVERRKHRLPTEALPLAMVALNRGVVEWVDPFMVRREVGAEHGDVLGLDFAPRASREAYLLQYNHHLNQVLHGLAGRQRRFPASDHFLALPPAGRMPAEAIDPQDFTQIYFPAEVDAELSIVPEDELAALVEESLLLPPIDLTLSGEELESTSVLVLIPVPREWMRQVSSTVVSFKRLMPKAAPGILANRRPIEALEKIRLPTVGVARSSAGLEVITGGLERLSTGIRITRPESLIDAAWRQVLTGADTLWYVRRRNLAYKAEVVGTEVRVLGDDFAKEKELVEILKTYGVYKRYHYLKRRGSAQADAEMVSLLASDRVAPSKTLMEGAIVEFENLKRVDLVSVLPVVERFSGLEFGEGVLRLEEANPALATSTVARNLAQTGAVPELDRLGRVVDEKALPDIAKKIEKSARAGVPKETAALIKELLEDIGK